jgi:hypothetical protein
MLQNPQLFGDLFGNFCVVKFATEFSSTHKTHVYHVLTGAEKIEYWEIKRFI